MTITECKTEIACLHFALQISVSSVPPWLILSASFIKRQPDDDGRVLRAANVDGEL
jgi:hypothetical protein